MKHIFKISELKVGESSFFRQDRKLRGQPEVVIRRSNIKQLPVWLGLLRQDKIGSELEKADYAKPTLK